jgi:hypothetical protein
MYQSATHAAMITQSTLAFNQDVQTVLRSFAAREPNRTGSPTSSEPYIPRTPTPELIPHASPEPLPVPPRTATPFPDNLAPDDEGTELLPCYADKPHQYTAQHSPSPMASGDTAVSQGLWINNLLETGPLHNVVVPNGQGSVTLAPLIRYDFDTDSPEILATQGGNTTVHSYPLNARPKPYCCRRFLKKERHLFNPTAAHANLLTLAVRKEDDVTL